MTERDIDEAEPTEEELRAAEALARALDDRKADAAPGSDAAFARALAAGRGRAAKLEPAARRDVVDRAMARGARASRARTRRTWLVAAAALLAISLPIGWALTSDGGATSTPAPIVFGGPTDALF